MPIPVGGGGGSYTAPYSAAPFAPRLSTPGPQVPSWGAQELADLFSAGSQYQMLMGMAPRDEGKFPTPTPTPQLTISNPDVRTQAPEFIAAYLAKKGASEFNDKLAGAQRTAKAALDAAASFGRGTGAGFGLSAYGFRGVSGADGTKGSAAFGLQPAFWSALGKANAAMKAAGLGTFGITDGWRSYAGQQAAKQKWTNLGKPNMAATPGRSVHGIGLAADLRINDAQFRWLKANGARFGIVNLPSESWHWQYDPRLWVSR